MKKRNSNIEILRILAMLMIIISHYSVHSGVDFKQLSFGMNRIILEISMLGNIGTVIFVLISGFYMINLKEPFKLKRIVSLYLEVVVYSLIIYLGMVFLKKENFKLIECIKLFLPITFKAYWFVSVYMIMYLISPFINKLLNSFSPKEYIAFITIMVLWVILNSLSNEAYYGNELTQFILFYSLGGYMRKYPKNIINKGKNRYILLIITVVLLVSSTIIMDLIGNKVKIIGDHSTYFYSRTSPIVSLLALSLLSIFSNLKENSNNIINFLSSGVLGIYLISDNNIMRKVLWIDIFKNYKYIQTNMILVHIIFSVCITFIVCLIIEMIRKIISEKLFKNKIDSICDKIQEKIQNKIYNYRILNK